MRYVLAVTLFFVCMASCNIINPDEKEPRYVYIPSFSFSTSPGEGTNSQKFTEVWLYANDNVLTVTDVPAMIPVLGDGPIDMKIMAGIKNNGLSSTRIFYPFIKPVDFVLNSEKLSIDTVTPSFTYVDNLVIDQADFDVSVPSMVAQTNNQGSFYYVDDPAYVFEGNRSGLLQLAEGQNYLYYKNEENYVLTSGNTVFLELNYSCNKQFSVGLLTHTSGNSNKNAVLIINPTTEDSVVPTWNKIYIDLGLVAQQNASADYHEVYFELVSNSGDQASLYLDNMKMVYFQQ